MRLLISLLLLAGLAASRDKPRDLFQALHEEAARPMARGFRVLFARICFEGMGSAEVDQSLRDLGRDFSGASLLKARAGQESGSLAFRTGSDRKTVRQVLLVKEEGAWRVASPRSYAVSGKALDRRRGKRPPRLEFTMRRTNGPYGPSAFSFTHVTRDPKQCKNRMDVWYCHNGDLHAGSGSRILDAGKTSLAKIKEIPVAGADWKELAAAVPGHAYVLHCHHRGRMDFFVKLRVRKIESGVLELEWTLLSDGLGAPNDIRRPQPLVSAEGADGTAGLCGKNG